MTEDQIQADIVKWFNNNYCLKHHDPRCLIYSIPNGGFRNKIEAIKLVATGMREGASDLVVMIPNKSLYIETKTDVGVQSKAQKEFEQIVMALGFEYHLVRNLESFRNIILLNLQK